MSKVDWINWKTDVKEIINPKEIEDSIMESYQNFNTIINPIVYEQIKHEIDVGGLSPDALVVSGESLANKKALEVLALIDKIKEEMQNLKKEIIESSKEQKKIEKEQLVEAIEEKLEIEKVYLNSVYNSDMDYNNGNSQNELEEIAKDRIQKLQERLDCVKAL